MKKILFLFLFAPLSIWAQQMPVISTGVVGDYKPLGVTNWTQGTGVVYPTVLTSNVAIGTTTSTDLLTAQSAIAQPTVMVSNGGNAAFSPLIGVKHAGTRNGYLGIDPVSKNLFLLNYGSGTLAQGNNGNLKSSLVLTDDGKVGIGTIAPTTTLEVIGKTKTNDLQVVTGAGIDKELVSDAVGNATWQERTIMYRNYLFGAAQSTSQIQMGDMIFRYNSTGSGGDLEVKAVAATGFLVTYYKRERYLSNGTENAAINAQVTINGNAGAFITLPAAGANWGEQLEYEVSSPDGLYFVTIKNHENTRAHIRVSR